jgi:hypothetical protein
MEDDQSTSMLDECPRNPRYKANDAKKPVHGFRGLLDAIEAKPRVVVNV